MRPIITALGMMRVMIAAVVVIAVVFINWTWIFTVPSCITGGSATSAGDNAAFGCWLKTPATDRARQQAFDEWARDSERIDLENRERLDRERRGHRW